MSSVWGGQLKLSIFGESHGAGIGMVLDGLPAGLTINMAELSKGLARRAPHGQNGATSRRESDVPEFMSGMRNGITTGTPIAAIIKNEDWHSADYDAFTEESFVPRPGHADYTGYVRYSGFNDRRGGGHFSGRLTAPLVLAGELCRQWLKLRFDICVGGHIAEIYGVKDVTFAEIPPSQQLFDAIVGRNFPVIDEVRGEAMSNAVLSAQADGDSLGGVVELAALNLPAGIGNPIFGAAESVISGILFAVPAVKGVEFGGGFELSRIRGSEANDRYTMENGKIVTKTNHNGGILGGITTGMPLIVNICVKPTPSIAVEQRTLDITRGHEVSLSVAGRHDACIAVRAAPVLESALAIAIAELMLEAKGYAN